jgi:hypothetical protein
MADVSPIMTHEAGAGPKVNRTEMIRPKDACAREDAVAAGVPLVTWTEAATPRATSRRVLKPEPQR